MSLLTTEDRRQLVENGKLNRNTSSRIRDNDFAPVVQLYSETSAATWLLSEIDPSNPDIAWGLIDVGDGKPEFGSVRISWLETPRGPLAIGVKRLDGWHAKGKMSAYVAAAIGAGRIVDLCQDATS